MPTAVSASQVKDLRDKTGAGFMDCKTALAEAEGDADAAIAILQKRGIALAEKRSARETSQGLVECYIHAGGRIRKSADISSNRDTSMSR